MSQDSDISELWDRLGCDAILPSEAYKNFSHRLKLSRTGIGVEKIRKPQTAPAKETYKLDTKMPSEVAAEFETELRNSIVGQPDAVNAIVRAYKLHLAGLNQPRHPICNILFLGPTGTGKTASVETASRILYNTQDAVVKIHCAEFQHSHEIAKLLGCFVPGTQVLMADGSRKAIENIVIGDAVITKLGRSRTVLDTYEYNAPPANIEIQVASNNVPIVCTPTHKILAIKGKGPHRPTTKSARALDTKYDPSKLEWISASDLQKNDVVVYPRLQDAAEKHTIDMLDFVRDKKNIRFDDDFVWFFGKSQITPRYIPVDENFARLAGYYVSEGGNSSDKTSVNFTLGVPHKQFALDDIKQLLPRIFGDDYPVREEDRSERHSMRLYYASTIVAHMFAELFGVHTLTKRIPDWFLRLPDNILWHFLDAAILGDGGRTVRRRVDYSTSSPQLYSQVETILRRLGITTQIQESEPTNPKWKRRYRIYVSGAQIAKFAKNLPVSGAGIDLTNSGNDGIQRQSHVDNSYIYFVVKSTKSVPATGKVYDISVGEDTSFVANGVAVKNSPPGYLGHRETPPALTQARLNQYHTENTKLTFILFDEIEKASDALWQLLLGIMDKAELILGDNQRVDFSKCVIVMTSNLGATEIARLANMNVIGFASANGFDSTDTKIAQVATNAAKRKFSPEFMNRIDSTVVFHTLNQTHLREILKLEMRAVQDRILNANCPIFILNYTDAAADLLIAEGTSTEYNARYLKRTIERLVVQPLTDILLSKQVKNSDTVTVSCEDGEIIFLDEYHEIG